MAITLSILNGFSKFFHCWKDKKISNKVLPSIPLVYFYTTLRKKFEFVVISKKKQSKNCDTFDKNRTSFVIWQNIVTIVAWSVCLLPAHMREDVHATCQLQCQWWSGKCHAKHAEKAASVHNTCLDKLSAIYKEYLTGTRPILEYCSPVWSPRFKDLINKIESVQKIFMG